MSREVKLLAENKAYLQGQVHCQVDQIPEGTAQPVQFPDYDCITGT